MRTHFIMPRDFLVISPAPPVQVGSVITASVYYVNPFPIALQDVRVRLSVDKTFSTNPRVSECEFSLGTIGAYAPIAASTNYVVRAAGDGAIWAYITSSNLTKLITSRVVQATPPILKAQVTLKPEVLEVSPGILTAFVRLPDGYPVRNITSATCDGARAERLMLNEDETEMVIKFRRQDIEEALAHIGKDIGIDFVVRGTWQGAAGTYLFEGADGITKISTVTEESWVIGNVPPPPGMQRIVDFQAETIKAEIIQEQTIGLIPIVFESQARYLDEFSKQSKAKGQGDLGFMEQRCAPPYPLRALSSTNILAVKGKWVSESLPSDMYSGVKQFAGVNNVEYTYFLANDTTLRNGQTAEASISSNSLNVKFDGRILPVDKLQVLVEVADQIGKKLLGSVSGMVHNNQVAMFSIPMQGQSRVTMPRIVSIQITSIPEISLLSGLSYVNAYFGWTNSVARLNQLLKEKKPRITLSIFLRLDTESGRAWD